MASTGQSITISYVAWDTSANVGKTGDVANHTLRWVKDGVSAAPTNSPAEVDATNAPGIYKLTLTAAECTCNSGILCGKSSTANVSIMPLSVTFEQLPTAAPNAANGLITFGSGAGQLNVASGKAPVTLVAADVTGNVAADLQTIKTQIVTCGVAVTVGAFVGNATHAIAVDSSGDVTFNNATIGTVTNLTNAGPDTAGTTALLGRLTAARAGYLDNLNVGGAVASHADIAAINQSASKHLLLAAVGQFEPGETYTIEMRTFAAADGSAVNADTTPTLTATGQVSGSLSANLSAATNPATGVYRWTYTPGVSPTLEQIRFDGSATINAATFTLSCYSQTVDEATVVWTATDQSHLTSIFNKLPANNIGDETLLINAIGSPMQAGAAATLASSQPNYAPSKAGDQMDLVNAPNATALTAVADAHLNRANGIETGVTPKQSQQRIGAAVAGKLSGSQTNTEVFVGLDGLTTRVTVTADSSGNRTAVVYN